MRPVSSLLLTLSFASSLWAAPGDWPQWRGPSRNGVLSGGPALASSWGDEGPAKLWESEPIPSDDDGGHGSVVVADGRAYLSVVWHRDEPSETRTITDLLLRTRLNYQNPSPLGKDLVDKIEATRESLPPGLRGAKLDAFIETFIAENFDRKQREFFAGFVGGRFKKGKLAIPLTDYEKLKSRAEKPFVSQAEFEAWVQEQGFADHVKQAVLEAIPATRRVAEDTVVCLDAGTGKTLWVTREPGEPKGRNCSSTPCVSGGRVFAVGSTRIYAVDAVSGRTAWSQPLPAKGPGSSPLVVDGIVVVQAGKLLGFDAETGRVLWEQPAVGGANASPAVWNGEGRSVVLANGRSEVSGVDLKTGEVLWSAPGGGDSTPAVSGDYAAVLSSKESIGFAGYRISGRGLELLWNHPTDARRSQSSPVIHGGFVYLFEDGDHRCVELASGRVAWSQKVSSSITSPLLADGKLYVMGNNGNNLLMLKASGAERVELGKANMKALWAPSPTIAGGRLFVRAREGVRCYNLAAAD
jgi:outer membrane protein assembly factor BamB